VLDAPQCAKGDYVEPRFALAGADFVAVDTIAATLLGFDPLDVGYLVLAAEDGYGLMDGARTRVVGTTTMENAHFALKKPPRFEILRNWRE
jgi:uncharacterized protein (DUF362 family)